MADSFDRQTVIKIARWKGDINLFVEAVFGCTPDLWQQKVLKAIIENDRIAMKACKGPGKTCVLAWACWWFLLCFDEPKIICTSITKDNMSAGLWAEMAKWQQRSELLKDQFQWNSESIKHKVFGANWFMVMRPWSKSADTEQQANTLAGMHADNILFILDEVGGIPDAVMVAAEAALTGGDGTTQKIIMAGNPTHRTGPLWRACTSAKHLWWTISITSDPDALDRTPRVTVKWAREQIEQYGRNNPWVLINVFGEFPPHSLNTLLSEKEVNDAMHRKPRKEDFMFMEKRLGVDVARFGDDRTVICARQGLKVLKFVTLRNADTVEIANRVNLAKDRWHSEAEYVDGTGGYGAGVIDNLKLKHVYAQEIMFNSKASDTKKFFNIRAEMWWNMAQWVKKGGALPNDIDLKNELTEVYYFFNKDQIQVEDKKQMKMRLGYSPDKADSLILTFADPERESSNITDEYGMSHQSLLQSIKKNDNLESDYDYLKH